MAQGRVHVRYSSTRETRDTYPCGIQRECPCPSSPLSLRKVARGRTPHEDDDRAGLLVQRQRVE